MVLDICAAPQADAPTAIAIMGPTATGKTDLAIKLLNELPGEIISVDSALVYRDMDIGTAKPDAETLKAAPHHLIDILDASDAYSAASFRNDALSIMEAVVERGHIPILAGGTMLYFRALQQGLSELPSADEATRQRLEHEARDKGWSHMHRRLQQVDPMAAERIHPNDPQRIQRALEVYELTGEPMSVLWQRQSEQRLPYRIIKICLLPEDRSRLHDRIATRFKHMIEQGFIDEVEALKRRGDLSLDMPSIRAVGYRQVWEYLDGDYDREQMILKGIYATRQLAKRQMTWLRKEQYGNFYDPDTLPYNDILQNLKNSL